MGDWAIYIHVPFCRHKCIYCDFFSITDLSQQPVYLAALEREIHLHQHNPLVDQVIISAGKPAPNKSNPPKGGFFASPDNHGGLSVSTVYIGGGTPSLLSAADITKLLELLRDSFSLHNDAEITIEANPGALCPADLRTWRRAGINRLSFGAQTFAEEELHTLTRIHSVQDIAQGVAQAREAGFEDIGLDLIYAIPGQTLASWSDSIDRALALAPEHLSMYGLTFEAGTPLTRALAEKQIIKCEEELEREMYLTGKAGLETAGYEHYEISNFARPGRRSRHNQKYWRGDSYLGLGPAAHSFHTGKRWSNLRDVAGYADALAKGLLPLENEERLTVEEKKAEGILLGLRRVEGIDLELWRQTFDQDLLTELAGVLKNLGGYAIGGRPFALPATGPLFTLNDRHLALTAAGLLIYDHLCQELYAGIR